MKKDKIIYIVLCVIVMALSVVADIGIQHFKAKIIANTINTEIER